MKLLLRKVIFVLVGLCFYNVVLTQSNVGIGTSNPDASALLELNSSNKGVLFPRLFLTNINLPTPVSAPTTGLLIWNTNADVTGGTGIGFYFWNVTKWEKLTVTSTNLWIPDANGIHSSVSRVGIGTNAHNIYPLLVKQPNMGGGGFGIAAFESDDTWHGAVSIKNNTTNKQYTFIVGGTTNAELFPSNFGLNNGGDKWTFVVNGTTNYVGFNPPSIVSSIPKSTIHVFQGDINIEQIGRGIILKSPGGGCWRITIDDAGNLIRTAIACP